MKFVKLLSLAAFVAGSLGLSSCGCCTGEEPAPALRPLPAFKAVPTGREMPADDEMAVDDEK